MRTYSYEDAYFVWQKARIMPGYDPNSVRSDVCGAIISFNDFGNRNSPYGWEIDHIIPTSKNGPHTGANVQPLHWRNNVAKGDGALVCAIA